MKYIFSLLVVLIFVNVLHSQDSKFGISFSGFVRTDFTYDTRQVTSLREGNILMYPADESFSKDGIDKNAKGNLNILSIDTRLTGNIKGPDFFDAKTSGIIEGEFFGTSEGDMNGLRLRHAFVKLDWTNTSLLAGQTWNPFFVPDCSPGVVSFNTGIPFQPFARNTQLRITQYFGNLSIMAAVLEERDYTDDGPAGFSTAYLRNSGIPQTHLQMQYKCGKNLFGLGGEVKVLKPKLSTDLNYDTDEKVTSFAGMGFCKFVFDKLTLKFEGIYGQNLGDMLMIGGYAVKSYDSTTAKQTYEPLNFGGAENTVNKFYGRGYNIDNVYRITPRIKVTSGKTTIAAELEYTGTVYGTNDINDKAKIINTRSVANLRSLVTFTYKF